MSDPLARSGADSPTLTEPVRLPVPEPPPGSGAPAPLPGPGELHGGRVVRTSGTLPFTGWPFVLYRHSGRDQIAAHRAAEARASAEKRAPSDFETAVALIATVANVNRGQGFEPLTFDDVLDLDGDDLNALALGLSAGAVPVERPAESPARP